MRERTHTILGRTAVITGGGSGIGRALAEHLSRQGSPVALADVDEGGLKETAASLDGEALVQVVDVRDRAAMQDFASLVADWAPAPLGAVINNAGVAMSSSVLDGVESDESWLRDINYHGVVNGTRAFLPLLLSRAEGVIVNVSSVYGLIGVANESAYCASKFAVRGFTESLRHELRGTGVRAVTVHPGGIRTNIARNARVHVDPEGRGRTLEQIADEFDDLAMTTPAQAAWIIVDGIEKKRSRILVGADAKVIDALARLTPSHYAGGIAALESLLKLLPTGGGRGR